MEPYTEAEKATAQELGMEIDTVRRILDSYMKHAAAQSRRRQQVSLSEEGPRG